jgi:hypothetical protein
MRRGSKKLDAYALAFFGGITQKNDTAFLVFLRERVCEDEHFIHAERPVEAKQASVRIDQNGFTGSAKTAAVGVFPRNGHAHVQEDSATPSNLVGIRVRHDSFMVRHFLFAVNESAIRVFPLSNLVFWLGRFPVD